MSNSKLPMCNDPKQSKSLDEYRHALSRAAIPAKPMSQGEEIAELSRSVHHLHTKVDVMLRNIDRLMAQMVARGYIPTAPPQYVYSDHARLSDQSGADALLAYARNIPRQ